MKSNVEFYWCGHRISMRCASFGEADDFDVEKAGGEVAVLIEIDGKKVVKYADGRIQTAELVDGTWECEMLDENGRICAAGTMDACDLAAELAQEAIGANNRPLAYKENENA